MDCSVKGMLKSDYMSSKLWIAILVFGFVNYWIQLLKKQSEENKKVSYRSLYNQSSVFSLVAGIDTDTAEFESAPLSPLHPFLSTLSGRLAHGNFSTV